MEEIKTEPKPMSLTAFHHLNRDYISSSFYTLQCTVNAKGLTNMGITSIPKKCPQAGGL